MSKKSTNKKRIEALENQVQELQNMVSDLIGNNHVPVKKLKIEPIEIWLNKLRATEIKYSLKAS